MLPVESLSPFPLENDEVLVLVKSLLSIISNSEKRHRQLFATSEPYKVSTLAKCEIVLFQLIIYIDIPTCNSSGPATLPGVLQFQHSIQQHLHYDDILLDSFHGPTTGLLC